MNHKTVGKIRKELELSGEILQIDKRIVSRGGVKYEQDTGNIDGSQQDWTPVWELEQAVGQWLSEFFVDQATQIQMLEEIKQKTSRGQQFLEQLLPDDILPSPKRKRDVIQACNNTLEQLRVTSHSAFTDWIPSGKTSGWTSNSVRAETNGSPCSEPSAVEQAESTAKAQEFECPRCRQEKIVGVNGSRRWCLNCGTEWPTACWSGKAGSMPTC